MRKLMQGTLIRQPVAARSASRPARVEEIERATMEEAGYINVPLEEPEPPKRELPNKPVKIIVPEPESADSKRTRIAEKIYGGIPESWVRL